MRGSDVKSVLIVALVVCSFCVVGCPRPSVRPEEKVEYRTATRSELVEGILKNMNNLSTLSARARVVVVETSERVLASIDELEPMIEGELFRTAVWKREISGAFQLERPPDEPRRVRFYASHATLSAKLTVYMLGLGDKFWMILPAARSRKDVEDVVFVGFYHDHMFRPEGQLSIRPQDLADVLLMDELFPGEGRLCYMEQWERYYIINVLRQGWGELLYSRIWIRRTDLKVSHHQLFTADGELICEARFAAYRSYQFPSPSGEGMSSVDLPTRIVLIWPRETIRLLVQLTGVKVNRPIEPKWFAVPDLSEKEIRILGVVPEELKHKLFPPKTPATSGEESGS